MIDQLVKQAEAGMDRALQHLGDELAAIRSGRASTGLVENLKVEVYGQPMILKSIAGLNTPDARTILITPWDKSNLAAIEKAIRDDPNLGLTPNNDGNVIRLNIPPLTEERRMQLTKIAADKLEQAKISLRNARHEALNDGKQKNRAKQLTDDDMHNLEERLNRAIEQHNSAADTQFEQKKAELMAV